jgi:hypothetical protein
VSPRGRLKRVGSSAKTALGYYAARRRWREGRFRAALRPTDTFLVGHPKSGNTWLAYMLAVLLFPDAGERITLANVGDFVPFVHGRDHRIRRYGRLVDPRVFRNENPQYPDLYPRVLYLIRDPRAALVSLWHMYRTMFDVSDLTLDSFLDQYMASSGIFDWWNSKLVRWDRQVGPALERAETGERIHVVTYEELVGGRERCLEAIAVFLGISPAAGDLSRAVARGAFTAMRLLEEVHGAEAYNGRAAGDGMFVRRGRIDGWREELTGEQDARIVDAFEPVMKRAGYL